MVHRFLSPKWRAISKRVPILFIGFSFVNQITWQGLDSGLAKSITKKYCKQTSGQAIN